MRHGPSGKVRLCGIPPREESINAASDPKNWPPCGIEIGFSDACGRAGASIDTA